MVEVENVLNLFCCLVCTVSAALASGLTMGMMSFDSTKLEIKTMIGSAEEKVAASSILPLITQHHLLLVTLLLYNALAMEALPVFLEELVPSWVAVLLSITLVLFCGEVSYTFYLVNIFKSLTIPIISF